MRALDGVLLAGLLAILGGASWWVAHKSDAHPGSPATEEPNSVAIHDVRLFDGDGVIEGVNVVIRDGRILAVGRDAAVPPGIDVIDGSGKTLLPGLIDSHVHAWGDARRDALRFGVTSAMDMMGDPAMLAELRRQRSGMARTDAADIWGVGFALTVPGGHGTEYGIAVPTLRPGDDVAAFVRARVNEGSDGIKLMVDDLHAYGVPPERHMPTLSRAQQRAGIAAAHAMERKAFAHIGALDDARNAVDDGVDALAHLFVDAVADDAFIASAKQHRVTIIPTLSVLASLQQTGEGAALAADTGLRPRLSDTQVAMLERSFPLDTRHLPALDRALESVRRLHAAGVPLLAGTDAGNPGTAHGASLHGELALFVRAGLPPLEALRSATSRPAAFFGMGDRGRIAPGMRADLLLVDGDPTRDIAATRNIVGIWKNGYRLRAQRAEQTARSPASRLAADAHLISDFEVDLSTRFGSGWHVGTDQIMGGRSRAAQRREAPGANSSLGTLRVDGEVKPGSPMPWAGTTFSPGPQGFAPVDLTGRTAIRLRTRGTPGSYALVILSGTEDAIPSTIPLAVAAQWDTQRIAFDQLQNVDWTRVRGIGVIRASPGAFTLWLDDVVIE